MKTPFLFVILIASASLIGCKSDKPTPKAEPMPMSSPPAPVTPAELNAAKLQSALVPQAVQSAFAKDHADAQIDTIEVKNSSVGESFYQISYLLKGQGGVARYFATGAAVPAN